MRIILILILSITTLNCFSQNRLDILTISGRSGFATGYDSVQTGKAKESGSFAAITIPVPISKKTIIYNSLNYFYFHLKDDPGKGIDAMEPLNLHGFILRTGIIQHLNNDQSLQLLLSPRLMSDLEGFGAKNWQMGFLAMYEKKFRETLTMGFGAMANQECFGLYVVPLVNVNWQISEKLVFAGMLPVYFKLKYKVTDKFTAGFSHFGLLTTFRLNDPAYKNYYVERQSIDLSLFANYNIFGNFFMEGRFGRTMGRKYKLYAPDDKVDFAIPMKTFGDDRVQKNIGFENGLFAELRLIYSIVIPDNK
jgi:hypothetical protein